MGTLQAEGNAGLAYLPHFQKKENGGSEKIIPLKNTPIYRL
jgi:hypothetical protein